MGEVLLVKMMITGSVAMNIVRKKKCYCLSGLCFLSEDAAQAEANYSKAFAEPKLHQVMVLIALEEKRVFKKIEWLESLGVDSVSGVCCKQK
jgi:hypothetical protein